MLLQKRRRHHFGRGYMSAVLVGLVIAVGIMLMIPKLRLFAGLLIATGLCLSPVVLMTIGAGMAAMSTKRTIEKYTQLDGEHRGYIDTVNRSYEEMRRTAWRFRDTPLTSDVWAMLQQIKTELIPDLERMVWMNQKLENDLAKYRGARHRPGQAEFSELQLIYQRQLAAIQALVQSVVNMNAHIKILSYQSNEGAWLEQANRWSRTVKYRWESLRQVMDESPLPA